MLFGRAAAGCVLGFGHVADQPLETEGVSMLSLHKSAEVVPALNVSALESDDTLMSEQERLEYLMGPWYNTRFHYAGKGWADFLSTQNATNLKHIYHFSNDGNFQDHSDVQKWFDGGLDYHGSVGKLLQRINSSHSAPHCDKRSPKKAVLAIGSDYHGLGFNFPIFGKTRQIGGRIMLLQEFDYGGHWPPACDLLSANGELQDQPWEKKMDVAVWRGENSGRGDRLTFVAQYWHHDADRIDVGFVDNKDKRLRARKAVQEGLDEGAIKGFMEQNDLLRHKYLVLLEGNDVASATNWALASNSVVLMPKPEVESWALEGKLVAGRHYVELTWNSSAKEWDLEKQIQYCIDNDAACKQIALDGRKFMQYYRFCDDEYQQELQEKMIDRNCRQARIQIN